MQTRKPLDGELRFVGNAVESITAPVVLYDDISAGQRAVCLLARIECLLGDETLFQPRLWRLDVLKDAACSASALADVVAAPLIIISINSLASLDTSAGNWIDLSLARKKDGGGAVAVMFKPAESLSKSGLFWTHFLRSSARDAGLDFFTSLYVRETPVQLVPAQNCQSNGNERRATGSFR